MVCLHPRTRHGTRRLVCGQAEQECADPDHRRAAPERWRQRRRCRRRWQRKREWRRGTCGKEARASGSREQRGGASEGGGPSGSKKTLPLLHYNGTKGIGDNLDKVLATYSCRRKTNCWPVALFHNMMDVSVYDAFVLWRELRPGWLPSKCNRRRLFLELLGKELAEEIVATAGTWRSRTAAAATPNDRRRKRCGMCPRSRDAKMRTWCVKCGVYVCGRCAL